MSRNSRSSRLDCHRILPVSVLVLSSLFLGCSDTDTTGHSEAKKNLQDALTRAVENSKPIESHEKLVDRLHLSTDRAQAITIGAPAKGLIAGELGANTLNAICIGDTCICAGDADCNDLFSGKCRDPRTDGACTEDFGGGVICYCKP